MKRVLLAGIILILLGLLQSISYHPPLPNQYVDTEYGRIAYKTYGEGEKILIAIHGSPGSKNDFDRLGPLLTNYTVYALDMPGFGESTKRAKDYGFSQASEVLLSFMDIQGIDKAEILGYSWGGGVASTFASTHPERTTQLIMLAGVGVPEA
ncbi:MAG: alpha/beta hydrolase, partial [Nanoarchaeota archaeon]|nr:alpha/beta hydrolase [Nanoarchaeota archaeon]